MDNYPQITQITPIKHKEDQNNKLTTSIAIVSF